MTSRGGFVWFELMTTDMKAAEAFYGAVIDWSARDSGMPGPSYTIFSAGDAMVAGMMELPPEARSGGGHPFWIGYIGVEDVDQSAERVKAKGGSLHKAPADIPEVGRFAVVSDPHGASFALFRGQGEPPPPAAPNAPGHVGWRELYAGDLETAFAFYSDLFGWTKADAIDMGPMGIYQLFAHEGVPIGGMMKKPDRVPRPAWAYYFTVPELDAAVGRVQSHGGQILNGPIQVPGGSWIAQCMDPQGAFFCLVAANRS